MIDVIEEDEEEYDEEGKICLSSYTGNHHFKGKDINCKYCGILKSARMSIRKSIKKSNRQDSSMLNNNPLSLDGANSHRRESPSRRKESLFKNPDEELIVLKNARDSLDSNISANVLGSMGSNTPAHAKCSMISILGVNMDNNIPENARGSTASIHGVNARDSMDSYTMVITEENKANT